MVPWLAGTSKVVSVLALATLRAPAALALSDPAVGEQLAIVHVRAFTMDETRGDQPGDPLGAIEDATLLLRDGKIAAIGRADAIEIPANATVHDGLGRTVLPALMDLHVHLFGGGGSGPDDDPIQAGKRALEFGVTTVLDLNAPDSKFFPLRERERAERQARHPQLPRLFGSGSAITVAGGHGTEGGFDAILFPPEARETDSAGEATLQSFVARLAARNPDVVKIMLDDGAFSGMPEHPCLDDVSFQRLVVALRAAGLRAAVHVVDVRRARIAVSLGVDLLSHQPFVGEITADEAREWKRGGVFLTPTLATYDTFAHARDAGPPPVATRFSFAPEPKAQHLLTRYFEHRLPQSRNELARLAAAGVRLLPGSDAGQPGVGHGDGLIRELEVWNESGIAPRVCLRSATTDAAEFLRISQQLGKLIPGFDADVLLVDGNPAIRISDLRRVVLVTKSGASVPLSGLARRSLEVQATARAPFLERRVLLDYDLENAPLPIAFGRESDRNEAIRIEHRVTVREDDALEVGHLSVFGRQTEAPAVEAKLGVRFDLATLAAVPTLAGFSSLRFTARSPTESKVRVVFLTGDARNDDPFGQSIALTHSFTPYRLEFSRLTQIGIGSRTDFDAAAVVAIAFQFDPSSAGEAALELQDLIVER